MQAKLRFCQAPAGSNLCRPGQTISPLCAEAKYRKIRLSNPTIARCIRDEEGAVETLQMMGWVLEEDGEMLTLPKGSAVTMKEVSSAILAVVHKRRVLPPSHITAMAAPPQAVLWWVSWGYDNMKVATTQTVATTQCVRMLCMRSMSRLHHSPGVPLHAPPSTCLLCGCARLE